MYVCMYACRRMYTQICRNQLCERIENNSIIIQCNAVEQQKGSTCFQLEMRPYYNICSLLWLLLLLPTLLLRDLCKHVASNFIWGKPTKEKEKKNFNKMKKKY